MASFQGTWWSRHHVLLCAIAVCLTKPVQASDDCAPSTWLPGEFQKRALTTSVTSASSIATSSASTTFTALATTVSPVAISPLISDGNVAPGEVNCRWTDTTLGLDINYYTCTALAIDYGITIETFFLLNPDLKTDCSNIRPDTEYCVQGFIEPLRATVGLCGPPHSNATCLGTAFQCCNSKTFTCGDSLEDCADGTCYEGACAGDAVFSTDGTCGAQHGYKQCAGVWGDCCNAEGVCGTGPDFCGYGVCQLGNCTISPSSPAGSSSSSSSSTVSSSGTTTTASTSTIPSTTQPPTTTTAPNTVNPGETNLPACGQTCYDNMLAQYSALGCASPQDSYCLCNNVDFSNGLRDCSIDACGTDGAGASSAIAFGSAYCAMAIATHTATATGLAALPSCGQTCFNNMVAQYSALGCATPLPACLCENVDFGYGLRDCANGACGTVVAPTVISYGSSYCASATAAS